MLPLRLGAADAIQSFEASRVHHAARRHGNGVAARGTWAAKRSHATHQRAGRVNGRGLSIPSSQRGIPARTWRAGMAGWTQPADRVSLGRRRYQACYDVRGGTDRARAGGDPRCRHLGHSALARSRPQRTSRIRASVRSGRIWLCRQPGPAGRQRHRIHFLRIRYQRKMARTAQGDRAAHSAGGGAF